MRLKFFQWACLGGLALQNLQARGLIRHQGTLVLPSNQQPSRAFELYGLKAKVALPHNPLRWSKESTLFVPFSIPFGPSEGAYFFWKPSYLSENPSHWGAVFQWQGCFFELKKQGCGWEVYCSKPGRAQTWNCLSALASCFKETINLEGSGYESEGFSSCASFEEAEEDAEVCLASKETTQALNHPCCECTNSGSSSEEDELIDEFVRSLSFNNLTRPQQQAAQGKNSKRASWTQSSSKKRVQGEIFSHSVVSTRSEPRTSLAIVPKSFQKKVTNSTLTAAVRGYDSSASENELDVGERKDNPQFALQAELKKGYLFNARVRIEGRCSMASEKVTRTQGEGEHIETEEGDKGVTFKSATQMHSEEDIYAIAIENYVVTGALCATLSANPITGLLASSDIETSVTRKIIDLEVQKDVTVIPLGLSELGQGPAVYKKSKQLKLAQDTKGLRLLTHLKSGSMDLQCTTEVQDIHLHRNKKAFLSRGERGAEEQLLEQMSHYSMQSQHRNVGFSGQLQKNLIPSSGSASASKVEMIPKFKIFDAQTQSDVHYQAQKECLAGKTATLETEEGEVIKVIPGMQGLQFRKMGKSSAHWALEIDMDLNRNLQFDVQPGLPSGSSLSFNTRCFKVQNLEAQAASPLSDINVQSCKVCIHDQALFEVLAKASKRQDLMNNLEKHPSMSEAFEFQGSKGLIFSKKGNFAQIQGITEAYIAEAFLDSKSLDAELSGSMRSFEGDFDFSCKGLLKKSLQFLVTQKYRKVYDSLQRLHDCFERIASFEGQGDKGWKAAFLEEHQSLIGAVEALVHETLSFHREGDLSDALKGGSPGLSEGDKALQIECEKALKLGAYHLAHLSGDKKFKLKLSKTGKELNLKLSEAQATEVEEAEAEEASKSETDDEKGGGGAAKEEKASTETLNSKAIKDQDNDDIKGFFQSEPTLSQISDPKLRQRLKQRAQKREMWAGYEKQMCEASEEQKRTAEDAAAQMKTYLQGFLKAECAPKVEPKPLVITAQEVRAIRAQAHQEIEETRRTEKRNFQVQMNRSLPLVALPSLPASQKSSREPSLLWQIIEQNQHTLQQPSSSRTPSTSFNRLRLQPLSQARPLSLLAPLKNPLVLPLKAEATQATAIKTEVKHQAAVAFIPKPALATSRPSPLQPSATKPSAASSLGSLLGSLLEDVKGDKKFQPRYI